MARQRMAQPRAHFGDAFERALQVAVDVVVEGLQRRDVEHPDTRAAGGGCRQRWSRQARNAASVLPEPVGARMRVCWPAAMAGQPCRCGGVGSPSVRRNHSRTAGRNRSSGSAVPMRSIIKNG